LGGVTSSAGAAVSLGGVTSSAGAAVSLGGVTSSAGAAVSLGGAMSSAGAAASLGGSTARGGTSSVTSTAHAGTGATPSFCTGETARVQYDGKLPSPAAATAFPSSLALDCCMSYGVGWHTEASLGFDIALELIVPATGARSADTYAVGGDSRDLRAQLHTSNAMTSTPCLAHGTARVLKATTSGMPMEVALCLSVDATSTGCAAASLYAPRVALGNYDTYSRFQIFLLEDATLTTEAVQSTALENLTLSARPWVTLGEIAYVEASTGRVGLRPGSSFGQSLRSSLAKLPSNMHRPFVAVADGVRIYLGTFESVISSSRMPGPVIVPEAIADQSFDIVVSQTPDPRFDARIQTVLTETSRLVP
jgi:hypothetical protein